MKNRILFATAALGVLLMVACTDEAANNRNLALIDQYVDAVESKDVEAMAALLHDDYKGYGPSVGDSTNKEDAIANWKHLSQELYEAIRYEDLQNIAVTVNNGPRMGQWVSNWSLLEIEYKDGSGPVELYVNVVYRIEDNKIIHSRTFYNEADVLRQLGYSYN